ncbi:MAG: septum formation initiator family protein [Alphaproteobacteria bacterium]|nr:septum formation initiator family protein [Alphaproteobacteria bacterium]
MFDKISDCFDKYYSGVRLTYKILVFIGILLYFTYQAFTGDNGYKSYLIIKQQVIDKQQKLDKLKYQLSELKQKVDLLSSQSLDLDILEERCRIMLNYSYPSDIIIRSKTIS